MKKKRISFDTYDAVHIYEWVRFYWEADFKENPEDRKQGKFGGCIECEIIGKRLEAFIGKKDVRFVDGLVRKYRKQLKL